LTTAEAADAEVLRQGTLASEDKRLERERKETSEQGDPEL
jgi:hypothetical protein